MDTTQPHIYSQHHFSRSSFLNTNARRLFGDIRYKKKTPTLLDYDTFYLLLQHLLLCWRLICNPPTYTNQDSLLTPCHFLSLSVPFIELALSSPHHPLSLNFVQVNWSTLHHWTLKHRSYPQGEDTRGYLCLLFFSRPDLIAG